MTSYAQLAEQTTVQPTQGGQVRAGGDEVLAPSQVSVTPSGTAFGPLAVGVAEGGLLSLDRVRFGPGESDDDGLLFGVGALAVGSSAETETSRRSVLGLLAATVLVGAATDRAAAQSEDVTLRVAELRISKATAPVRVRVIDIVEDVLPPTTELLVDAQDTRVGTITEPSDGVSLPAETTGTVRVYLRDSRGRLAQLLAWANSFIAFDQPITFRREFPDGKLASDYSEGVFVSLTEHPSIIGPIEGQGPEATTLTVGNTTIPHEDEGSSEAGAWAVFDGSMVYEPGSNPPAASTYEVTVGAGALSRWLDE